MELTPKQAAQLCYAMCASQETKTLLRFVTGSSRMAYFGQATAMLSAPDIPANTDRIEVLADLFVAIGTTLRCPEPAETIRRK